jgi:hypothetical protein
MKLEIRNSEFRKTFTISVPLYNRGDCLGIDFEKGQSQILIDGVSKEDARLMIRELQAYIDGSYSKSTQPGGGELEDAKGCPFCGSLPKEEKDWMAAELFFGCTNDLCEVRPMLNIRANCLENTGETKTFTPQWDEAKKEAIRIWNNRSPSLQQEKGEAALKIIEGVLEKRKRQHIPSQFTPDLERCEWFVKWDEPERGLGNLSLPLHPDDDCLKGVLLKDGQKIKFTQSYYCDIHESWDCAKIFTPATPDSGVEKDLERDKK